MMSLGTTKADGRSHFEKGFGERYPYKSYIKDSRLEQNKNNMRKDNTKTWQRRLDHPQNR